MKLRIKGNSIRLRLTKPEVERLPAEGFIEERTSFGEKIFVYVLQSVTTGNELSAAFENSTIKVFILASFANEWAQNDIINCSATMLLNNGEALELLVEKDFKCIDATTEDQSDNYENPIKSCEP